MPEESQDLKQRLNAIYAERAALDQRLESLRSEVLAECREHCKQFHFTAAELGINTVDEAPKSVKTSHKLPPKYQNPNGPETWSGRGARPGWYQKALSEGYEKEDLLIKAPAAE
ncbi:H-NS histone family protein [Sutterella sp.]|uniref:H-NS histone family protein n=1 Tax=Sutterella sp. TaxID=1981025 RepID=UPI003FD7D684